MEEFIMFRRFNDPDQANQLAEELRNEGIECQVFVESPSVEITFSGNSELMIRQFDFAKANKVLDAKADELLKNINKDYYLFKFTNDELYELLAKPDEWNSLDYKLAQEILRERGAPVKEDALNSLKQIRDAELSKPNEAKAFWIVAAYIFSFTIPFISLIIGWYLWKMKKMLPNGEKIYYYTDNDRDHGRIIFFAGIIFWTAALIIKYI